MYTLFDLLLQLLSEFKLYIIIRWMEHADRTEDSSNSFNSHSSVPLRAVVLGGRESNPIEARLPQ